MLWYIKFRDVIDSDSCDLPYPHKPSLRMRKELLSCSGSTITWEFMSFHKVYFVNQLIRFSIKYLDSLGLL
jgi:hypothetical protein